MPGATMHEYRSAIEQTLDRLERGGYIRHWAHQFRRMGEAVEDTAAEIRAMLFELLLRRADVCDRKPGYFFIVVKRRFIDLERRRQVEDERCEFYEPAVIEETVTAPAIQPETPLVRALRAADPPLVAALLDAPRHKSSGRVNHAAVAVALGEANTTYRRRLARLQKVLLDRRGDSYQANLF